MSEFLLVVKPSADITERINKYERQQNRHICTQIYHVYSQLTASHKTFESFKDSNPQISQTIFPQKNSLQQPRNSFADVHHQREQHQTPAAFCITHYIMVQRLRRCHLHRFIHESDIPLKLYTYTQRESMPLFAEVLQETRKEHGCIFY